MHRALVSAALALALLSVSAAAPAEIWVAPDGADTAPGTREQPLASPALALRRARELRRLQDPAVADGVKIVFRGGEYGLTEPVRIRPEDSGQPGRLTLLTAAPGESPVWSGGVAVTGWRKSAALPPAFPSAAAGQIWEADLPVFQGRPLEFRQLWVGERKATRARTPNGEAMERLVTWDRPGRTAGIPSTLARPASLAGVELMVVQMWEVSTLRVRSWEPAEGQSRLTFHSPESPLVFEHPWPQAVMDGKNGPAAFCLANAPEFLDEPGEWFADQAAQKIYYWPRPDEDLAHDRVRVPALETVLTIEGSYDRPVEHVAIEGLGFAHTTWLRPSWQGHVPLQAGFPLVEAYSLKPKGTPDWRSLDNQGWITRPAAAVSARGARFLSFTRCRIEHVGANGLDLADGVQDATVEGCVVRDAAINGMVFGYFGDGGGFETHLPYQTTDERAPAARLRIANNLITDTANEDWGGVALAAGFVRDTTIAHNEISHTSYTGISVGWGWTRTANTMRNNLIHANYIHHIATRMADTAGVYTLSNQPGTVVSENVVDAVVMGPYVHDPEHWFYLYTDEGTSGVTVRDNWCPAEKFLQNANGPGNTWTNNGPQVDEHIKRAAGRQPPYRD